MTPAPGAVPDSVARASASVEEASRLLVSPTIGNLERCRSAVEQAIPGLEDLRSAVAVAPPPAGEAGELRAALLALRAASRQLTRLLENAAAFHENRLCAVCGYTARGEPGAPGWTRRISLEA